MCLITVVLFSELDRNVELVDSFFTKRSTDLLRQLDLLIKTYSNTGNDQLDFHELEELVGALIELRLQLQKLLCYANVNKRGIQKILKKIDEKLAVDKGSHYLSSKVNILTFADPQEISRSVRRASLWLLTVTEDMNSPSAGSGRKLICSAIRSACPEPEAAFLHKAIVADDAGNLSAAINSLGVFGGDNDLIVKLLQHSISLKSSRCIKFLLSRVTTLHETNDSYERNMLHKYIINFGRSKTMSTLSTPDFKRTEDGFFITPGVTSCAFSSTNPRQSQELKEQLDDIEIFHLLLECIPVALRSSLVARDINSRMPLHYCAFYGMYKACELVTRYMRSWNLIDDPVRWDDVVWQDAEGLTPLHLAAMGSYRLTIKALLSAENRVPSPSPIRKVEGQSILALAVKENSADIVEQLIHAGMDLNFQNSNGETALYHSCRLGYTEVVSCLLAGSELQKCDLEIAEKTFGWTPLFVAAVEGFTPIVDLLVKAGADVNKRDNSGWYVHERAFFRGHLDCGRRIFPPESPVWSTVTSRTGSLDSFSKSPHSRSVKSLGHRYLVGKSMVVVTLGSTDVRKPIVAAPVTFDTLSLKKAVPMRLDVPLSLVVTAKGAEGEPYIYALPFLDSKADESLVFYAEDPEKVQLLFDIVPTHAGSKDGIVGRAVALLSSVRPDVGRSRCSLQGEVSLPIVAKENLDIIGTISFEFVTVTPFEHTNMNVDSNSTYWKNLTASQIVGHRGLGMNNYSRKNLQMGENTIASFIAASNFGAGYVEMDVQVTKDSVPVIYHDFLVGETGTDVPMYALTLEQFLALEELHHLASERNRALDESIQEYPHHASARNSNGTRTRSRSLTSADLPDHSYDRMRYTRDYKLNKSKGNQRGKSIHGPFVTLEQVLKQVPVKIGFNLECKYPMIDECELEEMELLNIELNWWVDTVLRVVYDNLNGRNVIFSSFHPDLCMMLALKQPNIPVLFLTESGSSFMVDIRASSLQQAIRFARRWNLLGIVSECSVFKCLRLVSVVKDFGLACLTYGKENNNRSFARKQIEAGMDAVIVDSVITIHDELTK